jgi:hypothetical protein
MVQIQIQPAGATAIRIVAVGTKRRRHSAKRQVRRCDFEPARVSLRRSTAAAMPGDRATAGSDDANQYRGATAPPVRTIAA